MAIDPSRIRLDDLEFSAEVAEWIAANDPQGELQTVEQFAQRFNPHTGDVPAELSDSLSWALGYYVWQKLSGLKPPSAGPSGASGND